MDQNLTTDDTSGDSRRSFLKKAAVATSVGWITPIVLSGAAYAQGSAGPAGTPIALGIGGPPTGAGCGAIIILQTTPTQYGLYQTTGNIEGMRVHAVVGQGANVVSVSDPYPITFPPPQPIGITTDGQASGFVVYLECLD